jgi:mono/diheme cytochrome c family protein
MSRNTSFLFALVAGVLALSARADVATNKAGLDFFEAKIRPILVQNCYKCHSHEAERLKGSLSVEFRDSLLKGGENGPAVVPGDTEKSLLIKAVRYEDPDLQMPPKGKKLADDQIADLVQWVKMGAPDPRVPGQIAAQTWNKNPRDHWAFKPIRKQVIPAVGNTNWVANPIDAFVLAKLESNGMKPSPPTDKRTLIRRATYDLIGLPPTPEEVDAFVNDTSPDAYAKVIDRLLASPQYGEHWGRYWLDVARYADTKGDVKQEEAPLYPYAWTYRDYVIRSFNQDKPFNKFVMEQVAADRIPSGDAASLAALGFLTLGPRFNDNINDIINDRIDVVCKGILGLTVTCARCHDHKFDPIPTADYYSLRGIFISSVEPQEEPLLAPIKMTPEYEAFQKKDSDLTTQLNQDQAKLRAMRRQRGTPEFKEVRKDIGVTVRQIAQLEANDPGSPPRAEALYDSSKPEDSPIFVRGEAGNRGPVVPREFLSILSGPGRVPFRYGSGRLELAQCLASSANPLTPRVIVNRIWLKHFGQGFVNTPDDFGNQSDPPTHPELLDYLATTFMQEGWSIKKLHRLIMLSNTYQQSSATNPRYAQTDPQNHLLWRANIRRLEFEEIRDSILAIGGQLDLKVGGRPVALGAGGFSHRRTVYGYVDRRNLPEIYTQFDFANPDIETGKRYETTVPEQALFMMNNPLVVELARKLVNQTDFQSLSQPEDRIEFLYKRIFQREPTDVETKLALDFIDESPAAEQITSAARDHLREVRNEKVNAKRGGRAMSLANLSPDQIRPIGSWVKYAHALLQANEAIFID